MELTRVYIEYAVTMTKEYILNVIQFPTNVQCTRFSQIAIFSSRKHH